jgi:NitT/TauT family transport system ATP-binding protein
VAAVTALALEITRKRFPGTSTAGPVIAGLRFAIPDRQFACLVGPSGCGKTTLLNIISGLDRDVEGEVQIDGGDSGAPAIGYMFQAPRLMPWLTVRENVRLALPQTEMASGRAEQLLVEMQLEAVLDAYPGQLSGGMQRRVALARAFVNEPRLLLLDEPFLSLDAPAADRLRRLLLDLWRRRPTTVLFVTHDLREALYIADRILFLSAGPARVVLDLSVDLPRPREPDGPGVEALRRRLLDEHPDLLSGLIGANGQAA